MSSTPYRHCPDDEVLQELAAGISSPEMAEQTLRHVARCGICGPVLRRYVHEFSSEVSPGNTSILQQLKSSNPGWQRHLVKQLLGRSRRPWMVLVPAFSAIAAAILAVAIGPSISAEIKIRRAQKDAAAAFSDRRTTEMRLTSVAYSQFKPFPTVLGENGGRELDEIPPELTSASSTAKEKLRNEKADPRWLQIQGRALLWEATPSSLEKAEKDFEKARASGLDTPSLDIDLAASYYERDSKAEHPNLRRSLNLLNEVLSKQELSQEDRASALYNLAIAYEKTQAWDLAVSTWEKYLEVDHSSGWAASAQEHLKDAKAKTQDRGPRSYADPSFFLQQFAQHSLKPEDAEQYQQRALSQWLPNALADTQSAEYRAVRGLAELFADHQDFWWRDLLRGEQASNPGTVTELSNAMQNNERGRHDQALSQARHAGLVFRRLGNLPAEMLAGFAEVYALRSKLQGASCLARASPLLDKVSAASYRWLQAQLLLEKAQCRNFQVELAEADHDSVSSLTTATRFDFPVQRLRVIGIAAGMKHQQGRCDESWRLSVNGLGVYWQGAYPPERLDQFYAVMWQCARETGALYLAKTLLQHTLDLRENPNSPMQRNSIREGMLHLRLANILSALREKEPAEAENRKASTALKDADQIVAKDYVLRTKIEPAELQLQHGDAELALATLRPVEHLLSSIQDKLIVLSYYRSLGNIHWELRHLDEASGAYRSGIDLAESSLASLKEGADRLAWLRAADECYRGLVRVLLQQKQTEQALDRWEWYQSRPLLQGLHTGSAPSKQLLRQSPKKKLEGTTAARQYSRLVFASFKDGLEIWISNRKGIEGSWVEVKQEDFERTVREFVENCANPDSSLNDIHELGTWLYLKLVQPVTPYLAEGEPISVELDRFAYNLPVEALFSPSGSYFGEKYPVVYSPGAISEDGLRTRGPITQQTPVLILDASRAPNSGFLPGIEVQKKTITALFPKTQVLDSTAVTWADVGRKLAGSTVFHYMGHGRPDGSGTALMFSRDRTLSARDLASEPFRGTQLAVLAACSTNKGQENGLWDSNNLVHALLSAGVPQILASHWNVDSETTSKLMISFYHNLKSGMRVEQAAYDARRAIRASMAHPYYWAGFSVTGSVD